MASYQYIFCQRLHSIPLFVYSSIYLTTLLNDEYLYCFQAIVTSKNTLLLDSRHCVKTVNLETAQFVDR